MANTTFNGPVRSENGFQVISKDASGTVIPVYWPGGVVPDVTTTASKTDIYSFKIFDGADLDNQGIFGVITGQNFTA